MSVTDHRFPVIESTLLKTPANYPYQEQISKTFLATAVQRSWEKEEIFARNCFSWNKPNESFSLSKVWIGTGSCETEVHQLEHKTINVSSSTHYQSWVCCTAGWKSLWITTSSTSLCVLISRAPSRQLLTSCIQNILTAQFHSIFISQTL